MATASCHLCCQKPQSLHEKELLHPNTFFSGQQHSLAGAQSSFPFWQTGSQTKSVTNVSLEWGIKWTSYKWLCIFTHMCKKKEKYKISGWGRKEEKASHPPRAVQWKKMLSFVRMHIWDSSALKSHGIIVIKKFVSYFPFSFSFILP